LKNKNILIISAVATVVLACTIFSLEKKAVTYKPTKQIYVATKKITPGTYINSSNIKLKDVELSDTSSNDLSSKDDIKKSPKIAKSTIYKDERVNKNRIIDDKEPLAKALKLKNDYVEFSINSALLDNYAGTYREGDIVTIDFTPNATNNNPNPKTENIVSKIKVLGAIDSQGKFLSSNDKNSLATGISFEGTKEQMLLVANKQNQGTFKIGRLNPGEN
jgi:Flp pilus assembly protein CpaB